MIKVPEDQQEDGLLTVLLAHVVELVGIRDGTLGFAPWDSGALESSEGLDEDQRAPSA